MLGRTATGVPFAMLLLLSASCNRDGRPNPKDTVKGFFEALRTSDSVFLAASIDPERAAWSVRQDLQIPPESTGTRPEWGTRLLAALSKDGTLRRRWLDNQIVLGESYVRADTALVEVSFLDRLTHIQYYNKMRLEYRGRGWIITEFRTM